MPKLSIIIPAYDEPWLQKTVSGLLENGSDIEIIVVLDGYNPNPPLKENPRVRVIHKAQREGLRKAITDANAIAQGKYIMKIDAHSTLSENYDEIFCREFEDNWVMVPARRCLNPHLWQGTGQTIHYEYYLYPFNYPKARIGLYTLPWNKRMADRQAYHLDEDMCHLGSCWAVNKEHFDKRIGGLSEEGYGGFLGEHLELTLKTQLGPWHGKLMRNKDVMHLHLKKNGEFQKYYHATVTERVIGNHFVYNYWWNDKWKERAMSFEQLIERFWPLPDWPSDWRKMKGVEVHDYGPDWDYQLQRDGRTDKYKEG